MTKVELDTNIIVDVIVATLGAVLVVVLAWMVANHHSWFRRDDNTTQPAEINDAATQSQRSEKGGMIETLNSSKTLDEYQRRIASISQENFDFTSRVLAEREEGSAIDRLSRKGEV